MNAVVVPFLPTFVCSTKSSCISVVNAGFTVQASICCYLSRAFTFFPRSTYSEISEETDFFVFFLCFLFQSNPTSKHTSTFSICTLCVNKYLLSRLLDVPAVSSVLFLFFSCSFLYLLFFGCKGKFFLFKKMNSGTFVRSGFFLKDVGFGGHILFVSSLSYFLRSKYANENKIVAAGDGLKGINFIRKLAFLVWRYFSFLQKKIFFYSHSPWFRSLHGSDGRRKVLFAFFGYVSSKDLYARLRIV